MVKIMMLLAGLSMALNVQAAQHDFSWQPQDPASWDRQNPDKTPAVKPPAASRWSPEEIARQQEQQQLIEQQNQQHYLQQQLDRDARNPACSQNHKSPEVDEETRRRELKLYGPDTSPHRQMFTGCSNDVLKFTLDND